jgi:hypothetical protein
MRGLARVYDRRVVLGGLAATALVPSVLAQGLAATDNEPVFGLYLIFDDAPRIFSRELLSEVWRITKGKTPQAMHAVLIETFGAFPLWFVDDDAWVVILGVAEYPAIEDWHSWGGEPQGYMQCDVRIIRVCNDDGVWEQRDTVERPPRWFDGRYVTG